MISYGFWSAMFLVLFEGMLAYTLDRRWGVAAMHWWNGVTSETPPKPEELKGFIYQRKANWRSGTAVGVILGQNAILFFTGQISPFISVVSVFPEFFVMMAGFYLGPWLDRLWTRKQPILDVIDKLESGETTVGKELKHVAGSVRESLYPLNETQKVVSLVKPALREEVMTPPSGGSEPTEKKKEKTLAEEIEKDPMKYIHNFTHRGNKHGE